VRFGTERIPAPIRPLARRTGTTAVRLLGRVPRRVRPAGYVTLFSPRLEGIRFGNWGSRPYEYRWASDVVDVRGLDVLDLGVGLPSQYDWYRYAAERLGPRRYVGIDFDERVREEEIEEPGLSIRWMDMTALDFGDSSFDVLYCLSVFEHLPAEALERACAEAHRVLRPGGRLVVTLDERWDIHGPRIDWNVLERTSGRIAPPDRAFGLPEFARLVGPWFVPAADRLPTRANADRRLLHNGEFNSCVAYALFDRLGNPT
jgi:SAM-dependent methyltransferase